MTQAQDFLGRWKLASLVSENQVVSQPKKDVTLIIDRDGRLGGNGGCNGYGGSYKFEKPNKIRITEIVANQMYCFETSPLENSYFTILQEAHTIKVQGNVLEILAKSGSVLRFEREGKQLIETIDLYVQPKKTDCGTVVRQKCYLVKYTAKGGWTRLFDEIVGFDFEEGYYYWLKVKRTKIENPPQDSSGFKYELVKIVKKSRRKL